MRKKNKAANSLSLPDDYILTLLEKSAAPQKISWLSKALPHYEKKDILAALKRLSIQNSVVHLPKGLWQSVKNPAVITGKFHLLQYGKGVIYTQDDEIAVNTANKEDAFDGDTVKAILLPGLKAPSAKIIEIIKREQIAARIIKKEANFLKCQALGKKSSLFFHVFYNKKNFKNIDKGQIVLLRPEKKLNAGLWQAALLNSYKNETNVKTQEAIVKALHNVPQLFPELALKQAKACFLSEADFKNRLDLRDIPFITIDGENARDFDDAIHVKANSNGWTLSVAIADVSHYVRPDSKQGSLDSEALRRGNSWYFPDSVEPMLPQELSNDLCSLKPGEDRLAMLARIYFDNSGNILKTQFAQAVIRSHARLTYTKTAKLFKNDNSVIIDPAISNMLKQAYSLYKILAKIRHDAGTLDFDLPEPCYKIGNDGQLENMGIAERNDAHKLIEEFMIAANEAVARHLGLKKIPFLYRVHPVPAQTKLYSLLETLRQSAVERLPDGISIEALEKPVTFQQILESAKGTSGEYAVNRLCLRSLAQAKYQPVNEGHFGLASSDYCHFTSPIRRYADLSVHRALKASLGIEPEINIKNDEELRKIGDQLNKLEREAMDCEREMARRLGCIALKNLNKKNIKGSISGVTDFGLFIEFNGIPAEGLMPIEKLGNDYYEYDQAGQMLKGRRTGQIWRLGQPVEVEILSVNLDKMEIRLAPVHMPDKLAYAKNHKGGKSFKRFKKANGSKKTFLKAK